MTATPPRPPPAVPRRASSEPGPPARTPRFLLIAVALAGCLVLATGLLLFVGLRDSPRGIAGTRAVERDRRPVPPRRPERQTVHRRRSQGQVAPRLFRLHALPGRVPDDAQRTRAGDGPARQKARHGRHRLYHGGSGARHAGGAEILCRQLRRAGHGADRHPGTGGRGRKGLPRLFGQAPDAAAATTTWTTAPSSM